jgi:hypothetical protein
MLRRSRRGADLIRSAPQVQTKMPLFFLGPIWFVLTVVGIALLISSRFRYLSAYLVLGSTSGLVVSLILSTALLFAAGFIARALGLANSVTGIALILIYLVTIVIGALLGVFLGAILATKFNRLLGWKRNSN